MAHKKTIRVVGAIISNAQGEILCALRSEKMSLPNLWEFPGGKVEDGEQPEQTLKREIKEELHCEIDVFNMVEDTLHDYGAFRVHLQTFHSKIRKGTPQNAEHAKLVWLPPQELMGLEWAPADIPAVKKISNQ